jgi:hypothetical protein
MCDRLTVLHYIIHSILGRQQVILHKFRGKELVVADFIIAVNLEDPVSLVVRFLRSRFQRPRRQQIEWLGCSHDIPLITLSLVPYLRSGAIAKSSAKFPFGWGRLSW